MKRTAKEIKQQTEKWLDNRWQILNFENPPRQADVSYYEGALNFQAMTGKEITGNILYLKIDWRLIRMTIKNGNWWHKTNKNTVGAFNIEFKVIKKENDQITEELKTETIETGLHETGETAISILKDIIKEYHNKEGEICREDVLSDCINVKTEDSSYIYCDFKAIEIK